MKTIPLVTFSLMLTVLMWDLWIVTMHGTESSVSQWITDATHISPICSFGCGALCAHFFGWMMKPGNKQ